jgi:hypothetical protein
MASQVHYEMDYRKSLEEKTTRGGLYQHTVIPDVETPVAYGIAIPNNQINNIKKY